MASILINEFNKAISKSKDFRMKAEAEFSVQYPTGFLAFDFMNGCVIHVNSNNKDMQYYSVGVSDGSMILCIGRSGCGKTTFVVQAATNIADKYEESCIFHEDIEGGVNEPRIHTITGWDYDKISSKYKIRNTGITAENFYERMKMIYDIKMENREDFIYDTGLVDYSGNPVYKLQPTIFILDSLALLMPATYTEEEQLSGQMSATAAAKTNASIFKRIVPMLKSGNIILFIINHITQNVDLGIVKKQSQVSYLSQDERIPGGNTPIYLANTFLKFSDHGKFKQDEGFQVPGSLVDITLVKSRTNKAGQKCTLVFNQNIGFDKELSMLILLKENKKLNGAGAYLYIGDHTEYKFAQKNFKSMMKDPEFAKIVMSEIQDILVGMLAHDYELSKPNECIDVTSMILNDITKPKSA